MNFAPYIPSQIEDISGLTGALAGKEPTLTPGTTTQFYRGDKTWQTLNYLAIAGLSTVAHTGAYADLSGVPSLASVALSGAYADLSGRPTLATVATTGAYADLTGKPTAGEPVIAAGTTTQYWRGDKSWQTLDKAAVGLSNVDNTSDAAKQSTNDGRYAGLAANNVLTGKNSIPGVVDPTNGRYVLLNFGVAVGGVYSCTLSTATQQYGPVVFEALNGFQFNGPLGLGSTSVLAYGGANFTLNPGTSLAVTHRYDNTTGAFAKAYMSTLAGTVRQHSDIIPKWTNNTDTIRVPRVSYGAYNFSNARYEAFAQELDGTTNKISFYGNLPVAKPTVTGSKASGAALDSLLSALVSLGLITDTTTA